MRSPFSLAARLGFAFSPSALLAAACAREPPETPAIAHVQSEAEPGATADAPAIARVRGEADPDAIADAPAIAHVQGEADSDATADAPAIAHVQGEAEPGATADHPGCFLLLDLGTDTLVSPRAPACGLATAPASTFKIPHALIALETGVVTDPDARVPWDGSDQRVDAWERDHDLRSAIRESVVWYFQRTARAIGRERMQASLRAFEYGNADVSSAIDRFWLTGGSLHIDGDQMLRFMTNFYRDRLPVAHEHASTVRALLVRPLSSFSDRMPAGTVVPEVHPELVLAAKTGTDTHGDGRVTWWVGHVACPDRTWVFVSRVLDPEEPGSISPAVLHGMHALDRAGVLRCAAR